jgi:hypothetical protein
VISSICNQYEHQINTTSSTQQNAPITVRIIVMGGGYDTRSFKLIEHHAMHSINTSPLLQRKRSKPRGFFRRKHPPNPLNALPSSNLYNLECYELDLPQVVNTKRQLIESRLSHRRPWLKHKDETMRNPTLLEVDLNNLNQTQSVLESILSPNRNDESNKSAEAATANIILFEGVMIYLDKGVPHSLLNLCSNVLRKHSSGKSLNQNYLCFADRLDNIPGGDEDLAKVEMEQTGWELKDWLSKPGLARHMGVATLNAE